MTSAEIRKEIEDAGLKIWQVAYAYGVTDSSFSRLLRKDFDEEQTERVMKAIKELKAKK